MSLNKPIQRRISVNPKSPTYLPISLPLLMARRTEGQFLWHQRGNPHWFVHGVKRQFSPSSLVPTPQLLTPPRQKAINSIQVDKVEHRFVLAGGDDAVISIYDLSRWGSEEYLARQAQQSIGGSKNYCHISRSTHKPIATSRREPPVSVFTPRGILHGVEVPSGHSSPIVQVQWYPVDSGAFLSASIDGAFFVWDTDSMTPVAHCKPFDNKGIAHFHMSPLCPSSAVVASFLDPALKLVDIRTSASSHTLLGHAHPGVSSVQWAPHNDVILASGGLDGTVRLWDIRKAGGRSCVTILNQDETHPPKRVKAYQPDYSHLPKPALAKIASFGVQDPDGRRPKKGNHSIPAADWAPNNYRRTENTTIASHDGPVAALSFGAGADGRYLVSAGQDGNLHIWDLRGNGHLLPLRFLAPPIASTPTKHCPMLLTFLGSTTDSFRSSLGSCWVANGSSLLGYSLERGGRPTTVLQGHLNTVTSLDAIEASAKILTAGRDGMILTWGKLDQQQRQGKRKIDEDSW